MTQEVLHYIEQLRKGSEDAYHALIELDNAYIPELMGLFYQEKNSEMQALLLEVIWQHRSPDTLLLLQEALHYDDAEIWKTALDGIVALNHLQGLNVLADEKARLHTFTDKSATERLDWIDEAYQQLQENLQNHSDLED